MKMKINGIKKAFSIQTKSLLFLIIRVYFSNTELLADKLNLNYIQIQ